jgi:hypothetical protein
MLSGEQVALMNKYEELVSRRTAILREVIDLSPAGLSIEHRITTAGRINDLMRDAARLQDLIYQDEVAYTQRS